MEILLPCSIKSSSHRMWKIVANCRKYEIG
nr:MAG TPA: hypothetical protein [Caudoviricetes sp.]